MKKVFLLFSLIIVLASCQKNSSQPTMDLPIYITDVTLNNYFSGIVPYIRIGETNTTSQEEFIVNTCSNQNGNSFLFEINKSYNMEFGIYVDNTWASMGFSGTVNVDGDGEIDGSILGSAPNSMASIRSTDYGGCGTAISGDICLFF